MKCVLLNYTEPSLSLPPPLSLSLSLPLSLPLFGSKVERFASALWFCVDDEMMSKGMQLYYH